MKLHVLFSMSFGFPLSCPFNFEGWNCNYTEIQKSKTEMLKTLPFLWPAALVVTSDSCHNPANILLKQTFFRSHPGHCDFAVLYPHRYDCFITFVKLARYFIFPFSHITDRELFSLPFCFISFLTFHENFVVVLAKEQISSFHFFFNTGEHWRDNMMWPGFDSRASLLCSERFFSGYFGFPLFFSKTSTSKFQHSVQEEPPCGRPLRNSIDFSADFVWLFGGVWWAYHVKAGVGIHLADNLEWQAGLGE